MKKLTKRFAMLLALVIASCMLTTSAMANNVVMNPGTIAQQVKQTLTIHPPANGSLVISGTPFVAYKLFGVETHLPPNQNEINRSYAYRLEPAFNNFSPAYITTGTLWDYLFHRVHFDSIYNSMTEQERRDDEIDRKQLAIDLQEFASRNGINGISGTSPTATGSTVVFAEIDPGYYLVIGGGKAEDGGQEVTALYHFITIVDHEVKTNHPLVLKGDAPEIDKKVWHHEEDEWQDWTDVEIGTEVKYELTTNAPDMRGYEEYTFNVYDTMTAGLTFLPESLEITMGSTRLTAGTHYALDAPFDGHTFRIRFLNFIQWKPEPGDEDSEQSIANRVIKINYSARLNEDAVIGKINEPNDGNKNKVYLEYSNNPQTDETGRTPDKETTVYTFEIDIYKFTVNDPASESPLAGAKFELYDDDDEVIHFTNLGVNTGGEQVYMIDVDKKAASVTTLETPASGKIKLQGLDIGTYYLEEIEAPYGYNLLENQLQIMLIRVNETDGSFAGRFNVQYRSLDNPEADPCNGVIGVENKKGPKFPDTGGMGTTIFYIVGFALMAGAVIALIARRRLSKTTDI